MEFGELLRQYREEAGLSQNALARAAGVDPTNLNRTERRKHGRPRRTTVLKLVRALGLSLTDARAQRLLEASGSSTPPPMPAAVLGAPARGRGRDVRPVLRQLRASLLHALDLVAQLEELATEMEER